MSLPKIINSKKLDFNILCTMWLWSICQMFINLGTNYEF